MSGSRDLLFEFWDLLYISGTVEARNFKFGTNEHINTKFSCRKVLSVGLYLPDGM